MSRQLKLTVAVCSCLSLLVLCSFAGIMSANEAASASIVVDEPTPSLPATYQVTERQSTAGADMDKLAETVAAHPQPATVDEQPTPKVQIQYVADTKQIGKLAQELADTKHTLELATVTISRYREYRDQMEAWVHRQGFTIDGEEGSTSGGHDTVYYPTSQNSNEVSDNLVQKPSQCKNCQKKQLASHGKW